MKKIISFVLSLCMLLSCAVVFSLPSAAKILYGDVNGDGSVNKKDSLALKKYLADSSEEIDMEAADVAYDGTVNKKDSLRLKQWLAGWEVVLGREEPEESEGLSFTLNNDGKGYTVSGIGACTDTDLVIPETYNGLPVTRIAAEAFKGCTSLISVTVPVSVKYVLKNAFSGCSKLKNVYYKGTKREWADVSVISPNAEFGRARMLTTEGDGEISWTFEDGVLTITGSGEMAEYRFAENSRPWKSCLNTATKIVIGDGITYVGSSAFSGFKNVTEVVLGKDVTDVAMEAFANCTALLTFRFEGVIEFLSQGVVNGDNVLNDVYIVGLTEEEFLEIAKMKIYNNAFNMANIHSDMDVPPDYLFDWESHMTFPTKRQIAESNRTAKVGSPYLAGWVNISYSIKYTEISVDIRADHLPKGTYCCAANFLLDYSYLESRYQRVYTEPGIGGYGGFQRNGVDPSKYNGILSFWDVYCEDGSGDVTTIRATQIYPEPGADTEFGGEGTGAHALPPYDWSANKWFNVRFICSTLENGNTAMEMRAYDYETEVETLLCKFDLGVPDVTFEGPCAFFLEDFDMSSAGEVRSMALRDYKVRQTDGTWYYPASAGCRSSFSDKIGSYNYFSENGIIALITTGVVGCAEDLPYTTLYFRES